MAKRSLTTKGVRYESTTHDDERLIRLEASYDSLAKGQAQLEREVAGLGDKLEVGMSNLADKFAESRRTQWPVLVTALGVIVTFMAIVGTAGFTVTKMEIDAVAKDYSIADEGRDKLINSMMSEIKAVQGTLVDENLTRIKDINALTSQLYGVDERMIDRNTQWREDFERFAWPFIQAKLLQ